MDYLAQYYKNRCEQLQEHLNFLQNLLNENKPDPFSDASQMTPEMIRAVANYYGNIRTPEEIRKNKDIKDFDEGQLEELQKAYSASLAGVLQRNVINDKRTTEDVKSRQKINENQSTSRLVMSGDEDFVGPLDSLNYDVLSDEEIQNRFQKHLEMEDVNNKINLMSRNAEKLITKATEQKIDKSNKDYYDNNGQIRNYDPNILDPKDREIYNWLRNESDKLMILRDKEYKEITKKGEGRQYLDPNFADAYIEFQDRLLYLPKKENKTLS